MRDPGRWSFDGATLSRKPNLAVEAVTLTLPVGIRAVAAAGDGAIVETSVGLLGVDRDGKLVWRMPDTGAWIVSGDQVIVGTTQGIVGFPGRGHVEALTKRSTILRHLDRQRLDKTPKLRRHAFCIFASPTPG